MIDALMPAVDSAVDELACTQNAAGDYCLLYTESIQTTLTAQTDVDEAVAAAERCELYLEMGCCAPMVVSVVRQIDAPGEKIFMNEF